MAKRTAYLHVGLPHSGGDRLDAALQEHAGALAAAAVTVPSASADEMFRAAVELRREHKAWGLRRKDVEGVWSAVCRRAQQARGTVVVGHSLLAGATEAEIDLLVDRLPGFAVHVVVTVAAPDARVSVFPDDHDLSEVLRRWDRAVCSPDRLHVVVCDALDPAAAWARLGVLVGFDAAGLALPAATPGEVDTRALRLIAESTDSLAGRADLVAVVEEWAKVVADAGYDVRGDLGALAATDPGAGATGMVGAGPATGSEDLRIALLADALSDSLAEVTRLRERTRELQHDRDKLALKKRRLKHRLAAVTGS